MVSTEAVLVIANDFESRKNDHDDDYEPINWLIMLWIDGSILDNALSEKENL